MPGGELEFTDDDIAAAAQSLNTKIDRHGNGIEFTETLPIQPDGTIKLPKSGESSPVPFPSLFAFVAYAGFEHMVLLAQEIEKKPLGLAFRFTGIIAWHP